MPNPKVSDALLDLALELGGTVELDDGTVFNAEGRTGTRVKPVPPKSENERLLELLTQIVKTPPVVNTTVEVPEATPPTVLVQPAPSKPVSWSFEFDRNADGTIKRIRATPGATA